MRGTSWLTRRSWLARGSGRTVAICVVSTLLASPVVAQVLPLKRVLPDPDPGGCFGAPAFDAELPSTSDVQEADRLAQAATQAAVLGDREGALDFLVRAADLDPTDVGIAYEQARTYEDLGRDTESVEAYCRYLSLAPAAADADEVRGTVYRLNPPDTPLPADAEQAFGRGVVAFENSDLSEADREFSVAVSLAPELAQAYFNRALVYSGERRYELAIEDFRRYLDLDPAAADGSQVLERIGTLRSPPAVYSPATALVAGMFIPGFGQFHTDRPVGGLLMLTLAGVAAGFGIGFTETEVTCRTPEDPCPPNQIIDEKTTLPYLVPGLAVAAGITLAAAIEGFVVARRKNAESASVVGGGEVTPQRGLSLLPPRVRPALGGGVVFELVRLRF